MNECRLLGGCKTGDARITKGYRLPARYVVHTVGLVWRGEGHGAQTMAFPAISTGVYSYPMRLAVGVAVASVRVAALDFLALQEVFFCCFSQSDRNIYEEVLGIEGLT